MVRPARNTFSRNARSSLNRLPSRATRVRLITLSSPLSESFTRMQIPSPISKAAGVRERDLLVKPVGIVGERGSRRGFLDDHRVQPAAENAHVVLQVNGVAEAVDARQDLYCSAPESRHGVNGRLNHFFVRANEVSLFRADR